MKKTWTVMRWGRGGFQSVAVVALCGMLVVLVVGRAGAWGSFSPPLKGLKVLDFTVHQYVDNQAFDMLKKDPAYLDGTRFLLRKEILAHEGVYNFGGSGGGPDIDGSTLYAEHYFNPELRQGKAPESTGRHYEDLVRALVDRTGGGPRAAAWGAHFLADMSVIYHVMGCDRATIQKIYADQGGTNATACHLTPACYGNLDHMSYTWIWSYGSNFLDSVRMYVQEEAVTTNAAGVRYLDYFDPWYFNGWLMANKRSSHMAWEEQVYPNAHRPLGTVPSAYHAWKNPAPSLDLPLAALRSNAALLAETTAANTRSKVATWYSDADEALDQAIQTVFTLWRASFSALVPALTFTASSKPDHYEVKAVVRNVEDDDPATKVQLRLTVLSGATRVEGDETQSVGDIPAKGQTDDKQTGTWVVKVDDLKNTLVRLEVCGGYAKTPDLQYAKIEQYVQPVEVENSVLFLMDCSGSMQGEKLEATKAAVQATLAKLDEKTEVAVMAFNEGSWTVTPFLVMTPAARAATSRKLAGLGSGGSTALAAAIRAAGNAVKYRARGKVKRALVIQSDGEETCGGNPGQATAEVNAIAPEVTIEGAP